MILFKILRNKWVRRSSSALIKYYRGKGILIGKGCVFRSPGTTQIDIMRPALVTIGDNVDMNRNFSIMTHDFGHRVFLIKYGEFLSSSGRVSIGSNIYFGMNVTILKGVTIGDNCIIGAGSVVTKSIPSNSVAAGVPCRVICSIEEYYERRKNEWIAEAKDYAVAIRERFRREPTKNDFRPEFGLYTDATCIDSNDIDSIVSRLGERYEQWISSHKAEYHGFEEFLDSTK